MPPGRKEKYTDDQMAAALIECKGMTFVASRRLGCDHSTMSLRIKKRPRLRAIIAEQTGQVLDTAELKLFQSVTNGDLGAIKYILSTKGKDRGYVERQEHTGKDGNDLSARISLTDLDREITALLGTRETGPAD